MLRWGVVVFLFIMFCCSLGHSFTIEEHLQRCSSSVMERDIANREGAIGLGQLLLEKKNHHTEACIVPNVIDSVGCNTCEKAFDRTYKLYQLTSFKTTVSQAGPSLTPQVCQELTNGVDHLHVFDKLRKNIQDIHLHLESTDPLDLEERKQKIAKKFLTVEPTIAIDLLVQECVLEPQHQIELIHSACPSIQLDTKELEHPLADPMRAFHSVLFPNNSYLDNSCTFNTEKIPGTLPRSEGISCLSNLSNFADKDPRQKNALNPIKDFFRKCNSQHLGPVLDNEALFESAIHSYTKHIRALIAEYQITVDMNHLWEAKAKQMGKTFSEFLRYITIDGFNRLFSPMNSNGASFASDADIKIVIDCERMFPKDKTPKGRDVCSETKKLIHETLMHSKGGLQNNFGINLELHEKSIMSKSDIEKIFTTNSSENEAERRYWATRPGNSKRIYGSSEKGNLSEEIEELATRHMSGSRYTGRFDQMLGRESDKGSIGAIRAIGQAEQSAKDGKPPEFSVSEKVKEVFAGNYIGKRNELAAYEANVSTLSELHTPGTSAERKKQISEENNWIFSTKYTLMRPFDYDSHHPEAIQLNNTGLRIQNLVLQFAKYEQGITDPKKLDKLYDKVTAEQFIELTRVPHFKQKLISIVHDSCEGYNKETGRKSPLVSKDTCERFKSVSALAVPPLSSQEQSSTRDAIKKNAEFEREWRDFGAKYFLDLFNSAHALSEEWNASISGRRASNLRTTSSISTDFRSQSSGEPPSPSTPVDPNPKLPKPKSFFRTGSSLLKRSGSKGSSLLQKTGSFFGRKDQKE